MKHLTGTAQADVGVPIEECLTFLASLEAYPSWYPDVVREVEVVESGEDGLAAQGGNEAASLLRTGVPGSRSAARGAGAPAWPGPADARSPRAIDAAPRSTRPGGCEERDGTQLELELDATMPVPRLVPLGGVGDAFASGFMQAAVGRLESGS